MSRPSLALPGRHTRTVIRTVLMILFIGTAVEASADTLTFSTLEQAGSSLIHVSDPHAESGYQILNGNELYAAQQSHYSYAGSAGLHERISNGLIQLNRIDGGSFSLNSIDLSVLVRGGSSPAVVFVGVLAGGGTVTQTFTPSVFGFQTFVFSSSFTNLLSVSWRQGTDETHAHQFDNIVVNNVPEPTTMLLLGSGLIGVATRLRKRRVSLKLKGQD